MYAFFLFMLFVLSNTYMRYNVTGYVVGDSLLNQLFTHLFSLPKNNDSIRPVISWGQPFKSTDRSICSIGQKCKRPLPSLIIHSSKLVFLYCHTFYLPVLSMLINVHCTQIWAFTSTANWIKSFIRFILDTSKST